MIRINLLPARTSRKKEAGKQQLFLILTALEAAEEIRERGADIEAYLTRLIAETA